MDLSGKITHRNIATFLTFTIFFQAMGGLMGFVTKTGVDGWYNTLKRSPLNPPDATFGIVWSLLYFLLAVAIWLIWTSPKTDDRKIVLSLFIFHMVLNWLWTPLFFTLHATGMSLIVILALVFTAAMTAWLAWPIDKRAALIFAPYIGWLIFAGHLTHFIWRNN